MSSGPIFIAGASYSGKTQLRLMLSAHPNIIITRRTFFWKRFQRRCGDLSRQENLERCLDAALAQKNLQALQPNRQRIIAEFAGGPYRVSRLFSIIMEQYARGLGKGRWGHQQGLIERHADFIFAEAPQARVLHMLRHPVDRVAESLAGAKRRPEKLGWETALWSESARWARRNAARYAGRYQILRWEDLQEEPVQALRQVCDFLDEPFSPSMLLACDLRDQPAGVVLSPAERLFVSRWTGRTAAWLGYRCDPPVLPFSAWVNPRNAAGALWWAVAGRAGM